MEYGEGEIIIRITGGQIIKEMMEIQIKLIKEQHNVLLARLGSDEAIQNRLESYINEKLLEMAEVQKI